MLYCDYPPDFFKKIFVSQYTTVPPSLSFFKFLVVLAGSPKPLFGAYIIVFCNLSTAVHIVTIPHSRCIFQRIALYSLVVFFQTSKSKYLQSRNQSIQKKYRVVCNENFFISSRNLTLAAKDLFNTFSKGLFFALFSLFSLKS